MLTKLRSLFIKKVVLPTVDEILETFTEAVDKLTEVELRLLGQAEQHQFDAAYHAQEAALARAEADRAAKAKKKIGALLS